MQRKPNRRAPALAVFVVCSAILLCGAECEPWINTEDVGGYWEKAKVDPALKGRWYGPGTGGRGLGEFRSYRFVNAKDGVYNVIAEQTDREGKEKAKTILQARTLTINGHRFLMVRSSPAEMARDIERAKKEGLPIHTNYVGLWRYTVAEDELIFRHLRNDALVKAAEDPRWKDIIEVKPEKSLLHGKPTGKTVASIPKLNAKTVRLMEWLADTPDNWEKEKDGTLRRKPPKGQTE